MPRVKRLVLFFSVIGIFIFSVFLLWVSISYVVPILTYHNIEYSEQNKASIVSPESFEIQMAYLDRHGYRVISMDRLVKSIASGKRISRKTVVITFDDAYENNYKNAFPVLKKYDLPAIVFVPPQKIGTEGRLSWEQLKEMMEQNISVGSHTLTESYLPDLSFEEQQKEIFESKRILQESLGEEVNHFAYPSGGFNETIKSIVQEAGYESACTTNRGIDRYNNDLYELNRVSMRDDDLNSLSLKIKFSGYYNLFRRLKKPY